MSEVMIESTMEDIAKEFYGLLKQSNDNSLNGDICLISHTSLDDDWLELSCGHKYNYSCLYNEVVNQKCKYSQYSKLRLRVNQLQCPYCRRIENKILPYISGYEKVYGINYPERYTMKKDDCSYVYKGGKKTGMTCSKPCHGKYCTRHKQYVKCIESKQSVDAVEDVTKCLAILRSGARKGELCGCKTTNSDYCKRHSKVGIV